VTSKTVPSAQLLILRLASSVSWIVSYTKKILVILPAHLPPSKIKTQKSVRTAVLSAEPVMMIRNVLNVIQITF